MSIEQDNNSLSRRDFMILAGVCTPIIAGALVGLDLLDGGATKQYLEDIALEAMDVHPPEFDTLPPMDQCRNTGRLFVICHYGYLANQGYLHDGYTNQTEGSYPTYWNNTGNLITALSQTREPTIFAVEDRIFQHNNAPSTGYSSVMVTINMAGSLKRYVHTSSDLQEQNIENTITALKRYGIQTICFAGEQVYKEDGWSIGCLVGIADYFKDNFNITGVEGCMYPLLPPKHPNTIEQQLYEHMVPLPST